ncbi:MAG: hypothetical protein CMK83_13925 [Pseudomonadales bacterium]|jgi:hypothetical protein|nr:hypothetical protein [Pseudomonadales bacterium]MCK5790348.1 hypothetical protein [Ketobacter sp.]MEC8811258.1 hypothetical protein [Pseudomonadota bacterium]TNC83539.1 MAG: hypothetical protein CSH49_21030 [Alcanivorax sp.]HAU16211.1 hypothetical protein [Gammaproteobacteria bacterium]|tara:strand:+ start:168 stop:545 length:378 start_codon:yes stop_codon:yes gene_type:complete
MSASKKGLIARLLLVFLVLQQAGIVVAASGVEPHHGFNPAVHPADSEQGVVAHDHGIAGDAHHDAQAAAEHCADLQCCGVLGCHTLVQHQMAWMLEIPPVITHSYDHRVYHSLTPSVLYRPPILS